MAHTKLFHDLIYCVIVIHIHFSNQFCKVYIHKSFVIEGVSPLIHFFNAILLTTIPYSTTGGMEFIYNLADCVIFPFLMNLACSCLIFFCPIEQTVNIFPSDKSLSFHLNGFYKPTGKFSVDRRFSDAQISGCLSRSKESLLFENRFLGGNFSRHILRI